MDRDDIQGIVLHGYRSLPFARYHLLSFGAGAPRRVLSRLLTDISSCAEARASLRLQLALSASGLVALGLSERELGQFSREFRQGMAHPERSAALGDGPDETPETWEFGGPSTPAVDALCMTFAVSHEQREELGGERERLFERFGVSSFSYDALGLDGPREAQPPIQGRRFRRRTQAPLGEFVLGECDAVGERTRGPFVPVKYGTRPMPEWSRPQRALDFGQNGSYLVVRKLARNGAFDPENQARLAAEHARRALGSDDRFTHRLLRRSRRLADGLWFMALNADIRRQFEFVQQSQCNEPGPDGRRDPLVGRAPGGSHDAARCFRLRGGAYFFLPSIRALNYLAEPGP